MSYLKAPFDKTTRIIIDLESRNVESEVIFEEINSKGANGVIHICDITNIARRMPFMT